MMNQVRKPTAAWRRDAVRLSHGSESGTSSVVQVGLARVLAAIGLAAVVPASAAAPSPTQHGAQKVSPNATYVVRGIDVRAHRMYIEDTTYGALRQSDDWGKTFSSDKGLPPTVTSVEKVVRFKSRIYLFGRNDQTRVGGVYSAVPTPGDDPLEWAGPTITLAPPIGFLPTDLSADSRFLYLGEYGNPPGGPTLWRSRDGKHWQNVFGPAAGIRHIHAVAPDPYHPGDVWMTVGDGVPVSIWRSRDYGARGSWRVVVHSSRWQSVQISFTSRRIYLAADTHGATFFVLDRKTLLPALGTPQYFHTIRPPGGPPSSRYLWNAFFGAVDPSTGVYYCVANDESSPSSPAGGSWGGWFAVRRLGGPVTILDPGGPTFSANGEVFVGGGRVWAGEWFVPELH